MKTFSAKQVLTILYLTVAIVLTAADKQASAKDFAAILLVAPSVLESTEKGKHK